MSKIEDTEKHPEQPTLQRRTTDDVVHDPPKMGFRHPIVQIIIVSMVCFTCPGMFNALSGLGGGGQIDTQTNSRGSTALYSTFAVMGFFGGSIVNKIGPRISLTFSTLGYTLYIASLLSYNINHDGKFNIAAGAILGVCAGILWTAQGVLMLAYSTEATKGRYIAVFWAIFNLGAVVGAIVPLAQQINQVEDRSVKNSVYIAFIVLTALGCVLTFALAKPTTVKRADGTPAVVPVSQSWAVEILNVGRVLVEDPFLFLLFPFFAASNYFYTWQFSFFNLVLFNPRTRALNNLLYWTSQIVGAGLMGVFLDTKQIGRRNRALAGWVIVFIVIFATWGGNYAMQKGLNRDNTKEGSPHHKWDWTEGAYGGPCFLYIMNGITDAAWQTYSYWIIGALTNNSRKIAVLVGIYKGLQSALAAVGWAIDSEKVEYINMYGSTFGLLGLGLITALPVIYTRVADHTDAATDELGGIDASGHVVGEHRHHADHHSDEKA